MSREQRFKPKNLDEEFEFYLKFTKPFVLNKSNSEDRARSVVWIKKLMNHENKKERLNYLKLLLFALQKPLLIGPFKDPPPQHLEPLPEELNIMDMIDKVLLEPEKENRVKMSHPTVSTAVSHDLTEYAAVQNIPNFGVQCYYATSPISINQWHLSDEFAYPRKYIFGAEAWEQSLSQLYHKDISGNLIKEDRTEKTITIDCCKDKPRLCRDNEEVSTESDLMDADEIIEACLNNECEQGPQTLGPRSPWACVQKARPCNHQKNNFTWDELSKLDSSYEIQPNVNIQDDFILNRYGTAQFETDQIALQIANKNIQNNNKKNMKANEGQAKKEKPETTKSVYDPSLMKDEYIQVIVPSCLKKDMHPSKLSVVKGNLQNTEESVQKTDSKNGNPSNSECKDQYVLIDTKTYQQMTRKNGLPKNILDPSKKVHLLDKDFESLFDNLPVDSHPKPEQKQNDESSPSSSDTEVPTAKNDNENKNNQRMKQIRCLFDQEIPEEIFASRFDRFNYQKLQKNKHKLEYISKRCSNCCLPQDVGQPQEKNDQKNDSSLAEELGNLFSL